MEEAIATEVIVEVLEVVQEYNDDELLTEISNMNTQLANMNNQLAELQTGINYTNELLYAQANNLEVVKGCFLFSLSFCAIVLIYKFLRWIF